MISYNDVAGKGKSEIEFSSVEIGSAMEYSCEDADITLRLMPVLERRIVEEENQELLQLYFKLGANKMTQIGRSGPWQRRRKDEEPIEVVEKKSKRKKYYVTISISSRVEFKRASSRQ
jgi:hypothetical protein